MNPHKHAELIKAWADGAEIQVFNGEGWLDSLAPTWHPGNQYRIKPQPNPDVVVKWLVAPKEVTYFDSVHDEKNLKLIFDGETGKLKSAEVLK